MAWEGFLTCSGNIVHTGANQRLTILNKAHSQRKACTGIQYVELIIHVDPS